MKLTSKETRFLTSLAREHNQSGCRGPAHDLLRKHVYPDAPREGDRLRRSRRRWWDTVLAGNGLRVGELLKRLGDGFFDIDALAGLLAEVGFFELDEHGWFLDLGAFGVWRLSPGSGGEWLEVYFWPGAGLDAWKGLWRLEGA